MQSYLRGYDISHYVNVSIDRLPHFPGKSILTVMNKPVTLAANPIPPLKGLTPKLNCIFRPYLNVERVDVLELIPVPSVRPSKRQAFGVLYRGRLFQVNG